MAPLVVLYILLNLLFVIYAIPFSPTTSLSTHVSKRSVVRAEEWTKLKLDPNRSVTHAVQSTIRATLGCILLEIWRPDLTHFKNSTLYERYNSVYTTRTARTKPVCIFTPATTEDTSLAMKVIFSGSIPYNVVSGGGNTIRGLAGVDNGILVSTALLNSIELDEKTGLVRVGAGCYWGAVFAYLEKRGLTAVGARAPSVGVSGFLLGGGISFQTNHYGLGCDYVENYKLVTIQGEILDVNKNGNHRDLFYGLKGSGSNFGIVTHFDIRTIPLLPVYGGSLRVKGKPRGDLFSAIVDFYRKNEDTPDAQVIYSYTQNFALDADYTDITIFRDNYTEPDGAPPPEFKRILDLKVDSSTVGRKTVPSMVFEMSAQVPDPDSRRELRGFSVKMDVGLLNDILTIFENEVVAVKAGDAWIPTIAFQYLPDTAAYMSKRRGGNMLGLDSDFTFVTLGAYWSDATLDKRIHQAMDTIMKNSIALAYDRGMTETFAYYNYAPPMLDPILTYGSANIKKLQALRKKYDRYNTIDKLLFGAHRLPASE